MTGDQVVDRDPRVYAPAHRIDVNVERLVVANYSHVGLETRLIETLIPKAPPTDPNRSSRAGAS